MTVWFQASVAKELVETKLPTMLNNLQNMMNDDGYFINKQVSAMYVLQIAFLHAPVIP